jgi:hypothetical protein
MFTKRQIGSDILIADRRGGFPTIGNKMQKMVEVTLDGSGTEPVKSQIFKILKSERRGNLSGQ